MTHTEFPPHQHCWCTSSQGWSFETGHQFVTECTICGLAYEWDDESHREALRISEGDSF